MTDARSFTDLSSSALAQGRQGGEAVASVSRPRESNLSYVTDLTTTWSADPRAIGGGSPRMS
jgi:hypothetical protein